MANNIRIRRPCNAIALVIGDGGKRKSGRRDDSRQRRPGGHGRFADHCLRNAASNGRRGGGGTMRLDVGGQTRAGRPPSPVLTPFSPANRRALFALYRQEATASPTPSSPSETRRASAKANIGRSAGRGVGVGQSSLCRPLFITFLLLPMTSGQPTAVRRGRTVTRPPERRSTHPIGDDPHASSRL
uniref:Uncharacterized protein n=1 Tax=Plectus sambesii TaxID=2011161 RepID=A0A914V3G2_9BILA